MLVSATLSCCIASSLWVWPCSVQQFLKSLRSKLYGDKASVLFVGFSPLAVTRAKKLGAQKQNGYCQQQPCPQNNPRNCCLLRVSYQFSAIFENCSSQDLLGEAMTLKVV